MLIRSETKQFFVSVGADLDGGFFYTTYMTR